MHCLTSDLINVVTRAFKFNPGWYLYCAAELKQTFVLAG